MTERVSASLESPAQRTQAASIPAVQGSAGHMEGQSETFVDNRPEPAIQRKLADMVSNSPCVAAQRAMHDSVHSSPRMVTQRKASSALFGNAIPQRAAAQAHGRVAPAIQKKGGVAINDNQGLEREADAMGMKAMAMQPSDDARRSTPSIAGSAIQRYVIQRTIGIGTGIAVEQKSLVYLAVQLTNHMGDYDYARASLTPLDGNSYATMDLLKAAMPAPLTADQVYVGGAAVTIVGTGNRCNAHMTQGEVVAALRTNKADISVANGNDQRIQIGQGRVRGWKWGYVRLKFTNGQLEYWHAHDGFQVG